MPIFPWLNYGAGYTDAWSKPQVKKAKKAKRATKKKTQKKGKRS